MHSQNLWNLLGQVSMDIFFLNLFQNVYYHTGQTFLGATDNDGLMDLLQLFFFFTGLFIESSKSKTTFSF